MWLNSRAFICIGFAPSFTVVSLFLLGRHIACALGNGASVLDEGDQTLAQFLLCRLSAPQL